MPYSIDPTEAQQSIIDHLEETFPGVRVIPDGMPDISDEYIDTFPDGSIKPFLLLQFSEPRRTGRTAFAEYKLDAHDASVDILAVTRDATSGRILLNKVTNELVGFRVEGGGRMHKGTSLWGESRQLIDDTDRPNRWVRTSNFQFGIASRKVV